MFKRLFLAGGMAAVLAWGSPSAAGVVIAFEETAASVVGTLSGSLDVSGLQPDDSFKFFNSVTPQNGLLAMGGFANPADAYLLSALVPFGPGVGPVGTFASSSSGSPFAIARNASQQPIVVLRDGYAGEELSGTITFSLPSRNTFAELGMTPGTYVLELLAPAGGSGATAPANAGQNGDTITLVIGAQPPAIPLPAGLPLLLGALGLVAVLRRREG